MALGAGITLVVLFTLGCAAADSQQRRAVRAVTQCTEGTRGDWSRTIFADGSIRIQGHADEIDVVLKCLRRRGYR